jgi:PAS domain S-box-containing protein
MKPGLEPPLPPVPDPSEERFRLIFEQAAVGVALTDRRTGRFVKINQKYCDMLGYSVSEMLEKGYQDVTHPDDLQANLSRTAELRSGAQRSFTWEKRYLHKNGEVVWANLTVSTLCEAGEAPRLNIATVEDITARKHAEAALLEANEQLEARVRLRTAELEAANRHLQEEIAERGVAEELLRESEQHYRTMADSISQLAWITDCAGNIVWVNRRCYAYTGLPLEGLQGWEWQSLVEPAALPQVLECWHASISSGEPFDIEYPLLGCDGNYRRFLTRAVPLRDSEGTVVQWFGTSTDITQLKETEEELRRHRDGLDALIRERTAELEGRNAQLEIEISERKRVEVALSQSEQRFRAVVEDQTELITRMLPDGSYSFVNQAFCRFFGKVEREVLGTTWHPDAVGEDQPMVEKRLSYLSPANPVVVVENRVVSGAGEERWMQFVNRGFFDARGRLVETQAVARDITERKLAEQMLHVYADEVQDLYDNAPCGYHSLDENGFFVRMNDTELGWLGYQRHEVIGVKNFADLVTPEGADFFRAHFPRFLERGWISDLEFEMVRRDGSRLPVILNSIALRDAEGRYIMSRCTVFDNTERRKAEDERRQSEEKFRGIFENAPFGIFETTPEGRLLRVNPSSARMFGYGSPQLMLEALGGDVGRVYQHTEERDLIVAKALASEQYAEGELAFLRRDGSPFVANLRMRAVRCAAGTLLEGFLEDISSRKGAEEALRKSELQFRQMAGTIDEVFWLSSPASQSVHYVSPAYERVWGRSSAELYLDPRLWLLGIVPEDLPQVLRDLHRMNSGSAVEMVYRIVRPDGELRWICDRGYPLRDALGKVTMLTGVAADITERKLAEEGLRRYARRLVQLEENLRKRIAMELHDDIGQVLTALGLNLAHIDNRLKRGDGKDLAEVLVDSRLLTKEISRSVRNLMVDLHPAQLEEYGLAAAVRSHAEQYAQRTGIQVAVHTDSACPRLNAAQEIALFRITQEALNNVVKYAGASKVTVSLCCVDGLISYRIADDGAGFLPGCAAPQQTGSGWGLTIMRERAELIGGILRIASAPGEGTTVSVDFRGEP